MYHMHTCVHVHSHIHYLSCQTHAVLHMYLPEEVFLEAPPGSEVSYRKLNLWTCAAHKNHREDPAGGGGGEGGGSEAGCGAGGGGEGVAVRQGGVWGRERGWWQ